MPRRKQTAMAAMAALALTLAWLGAGTAWANCKEVRPISSVQSDPNLVNSEVCVRGFVVQVAPDSLVISRGRFLLQDFSDRRYSIQVETGKLPALGQEIVVKGRVATQNNTPFLIQILDGGGERIGGGGGLGGLLEDPVYIMIGAIVLVMAGTLIYLFKPEPKAKAAAEPARPERPEGPAVFMEAAPTTSVAVGGQQAYKPPAPVTQDYELWGRLKVLESANPGLPGRTLNLGSFDGRSTVVVGREVGPEGLSIDDTTFSRKGMAFGVVGGMVSVRNLKAERRLLVQGRGGRSFQLSSQDPPLTLSDGDVLSHEKSRLKLEFQFSGIRTVDADSLGA